MKESGEPGSGQAHEAVPTRGDRSRRSGGRSQRRRSPPRPGAGGHLRSRPGGSLRGHKGDTALRAGEGAAGRTTWPQGPSSRTRPSTRVQTPGPRKGALALVQARRASAESPPQPPVLVPAWGVDAVPRRGTTASSHTARVGRPRAPGSVMALGWGWRGEQLWSVCREPPGDPVSPWKPDHVFCQLCSRPRGGAESMNPRLYKGV